MGDIGVNMSDMFRHRTLAEKGTGWLFDSFELFGRLRFRDIGNR